MGRKILESMARCLREAVSAERDSLAPYRERIMLLMGIFALVLLLPYTLNNLLQGRLIVAAILLVAMAAMLVDIVALRRSQPPPIPYAALLIPFLAGITVATIRQGVPGVLWSYPVVLFCYFVLSRRMAMLFSLLVLVYVAGLAAYFIDLPLAFRLAGTLLLAIVMINIVLNVIADLHHTLSSQAMTDPLTGVFNRRHMGQCLENTLARAEQQALAAALLMVDIDHFKQINDQFGHAAGDLALTRIVALIRQRLRCNDRVFRWGGEEFLILAEGAGNADANTLAEAIRNTVENAEVIPQTRVTVSIGVGQYTPGMTLDEWIRHADSALYQAKAEGRNRVVLAA